MDRVVGGWAMTTTEAVRVLGRAMASAGCTAVEFERDLRAVAALMGVEVRPSRMVPGTYARLRSGTQPTPAEMLAEARARLCPPRK